MAQFNFSAVIAAAKACIRVLEDPEAGLNAHSDALDTLVRVAIPLAREVAAERRLAALTGEERSLRGVLMTSFDGAVLLENHGIYSIPEGLGLRDLVWSHKSGCEDDRVHAIGDNLDLDEVWGVVLDTRDMGSMHGDTRIALVEISDGRKVVVIIESVYVP